MRIAAFSDIHGNAIALEAVLSDIALRGGVDGYWVLGDLVAIGGEPLRTLEMLVHLPNAVFVQGNTERYMLTGERPYPSFEDAKADTDLLPRLVEVAHSFAWTMGAISATGWREWLAALSLEQRLTLPDGTRVLLTHVTPGLNDGPGIHPSHSDAQLGQLVLGCDAELVVVGHTHWPLERTVDGIRVVNDGSVSNPWSTDRRASYVLLEADERGVHVEFRRVAYDYAAAIEAVRRAHHPSGAFIIDWLAGNRAPWWQTRSGTAWAGFSESR